MARIEDGIGSDERDAWFICVLCLAYPDGTTHSFEGRVDGSITWPPRGEKGHGYDPIFTPTGENRTFAEMEEAERNAISHRARAFQAFKPACLA